MKRKCAGFTLLELVIVIIIVSVLASIALPRFFKIIERSKAVEAISSLRMIRMAIERRYMMTGDFCKAVYGNGGEPDLDWAGLAIDDPGKVPNAHFDYKGGNCLPTDRYYVRAMRTTFDGGSGLSADYLEVYLDPCGCHPNFPVGVIGYGVYHGITTGD
jgi:prepilin-type N-terminal cleavage/methylation domain-containing protein